MVPALRYLDASPSRRAAAFSSARRSSSARAQARLLHSGMFGVLDMLWC